MAIKTLTQAPKSATDLPALSLGIGSPSMGEKGKKAGRAVWKAELPKGLRIDGAFKIEGRDYTLIGVDGKGWQLIGADGKLFAFLSI